LYNGNQVNKPHEKDCYFAEKIKLWKFLYQNVTLKYKQSKTIKLK